MEGQNLTPESLTEKLMRFGRLLCELRNKSGKTVGELALEIGVKYEVLRKWESGENFPKPEKLPVIAKAYNVTLEKLTEAFNISQTAREEEKGFRKKSKPSSLHPGPDTELYGPGRSKFTLRKPGSY